MSVVALALRVQAPATLAPKVTVVPSDRSVPVMTTLAVLVVDRPLFGERPVTVTFTVSFGRPGVGVGSPWKSLRLLPTSRLVLARASEALVGG